MIEEALFIKFTWLVVVIEFDHSWLLVDNQVLLYEYNCVNDEFMLLNLLTEKQNTTQLTPKI